MDNILLTHAEWKKLTGISKTRRNAGRTGETILELIGETLIAAPRETVWNALMNPDILARSIDGVERLERTEDGRFEGRMNAKVGPVRATFDGTARVTETEKPHRYVLVGEGKGGVAGFAKGSAEIELESVAEQETRLRYTAKSQVGGKLAQLGTRLVEGAAQNYAERFFENFKAQVEGGASEGLAPSVDSSEDSSAAPVIGTVDESEPFRSSARGLGPMGWALIVLLVTAGIVAIQFT